MSNPPPTPAAQRRRTDTYAEAQGWVRRRLRHEPATRIKKWIKAQYLDAGEAMRAVGVNPKTPEDQAIRRKAKYHRRWLGRLERALAQAMRAKRQSHEAAPARPATPLWKRTKPGWLGMEVQAHQAKQANEDDPEDRAA